MHMSVVHTRYRIELAGFGVLLDPDTKWEYAVLRTYEDTT